MNALEVAATLLGVANILLLVRRSIWNYPFGLAMVAITALVVFRQRLYSDTILQCFFFAAQIYGWWAWGKAGGVDKAISVERLNWSGRIGWTTAILALGALWGASMHVYTNAAMPWLDATLTVASMAAQLMLARRLIENWLIWVMVDVGTIYMYVYKGLYWFGGLYVLFLLFSVVGLIEWARAERRQAISAT